MTLPDEIIICGVPYTLEFVQDSIDSEEEYGRISFQGRVIRIQDHGDDMVNMQTLVHEVFHGISHHYGLHLDDDEEKHEAMDVLASVLVDTLVRSDILPLD